MELVCIILIMFPFTSVYANYQGEALLAFKSKLADPNGTLSSWEYTDPGMDYYTDLSEWFRITYHDTTDSVERIDLGNCELAGPLAPELGKLDKLQYLELYNNKITGEIPKELGDLTNLVSLDLYGNSLTGPIPQELVKLKKLRFLRLNDNNLSGVVPDELKNILVLNLSGNPHLIN